MVEDIAFEYDRISNFEGLVTLPLTLDGVLLHTIVHHFQSLSTCQISLKSKKLCGWTDVRM